MRYLLGITFLIMMLFYNIGYAKGQPLQPSFAVCFVEVRQGHWQYKHEWMRPVSASIKTTTSDMCGTYCF